MPGQVVDPALLPELAHDGVNPREPRLGFGPLGQGLHVAVPGDPHTDGVPLHLVEAGVVGGGCVEELPPQQLAVQGEGWRAVLLHLGPERERAEGGVSVGLKVALQRLKEADRPCGRGR